MSLIISKIERYQLTTDPAFEPVLLTQASSEFLKKYKALITNKGIVGCYLQTELGHGSNVAQLETTATYIPQSREFEIHSPSLTSTKWWVGGLGKFATHGVLQAKLILPGGRDAGPHLFFIQLRSLGLWISLGTIVCSYAIVDRGSQSYAWDNYGRHRFIFLQSML